MVINLQVQIFSSSGSNTITYFYVGDISAGTLQIKFGETDDWVTIVEGFTIKTVAFVEFWLKPSIANNISVVVAQNS